MKLNEFSSNLVGYIFPILLIGLWINGCSHGQRKHDIDAFSASFFVCWYYGLERFWHKTDENELNDNVKAAIYILMKYPEGIDPSEQMEYNTIKSEFKDLLDNYEKTEINYISKGALTYLNFKNEFERESYKSIVDASENGIFEFKLTPKMDSMLVALGKYGLEEEAEQFRGVMNDLHLAGNQMLEENPDHFTDVMKNNDFKTSLDREIKSRLKIYDELFN